MPPHPTWYAGREAIVIAARKGFDPEFGRLRSVVAGANLQPAVAHYLLAPGEPEYRALALDVLRVVHGEIAEITGFPADVFPAFGLPAEL
jgi:RNA polymerase sigma-70 factor (ECF subfamily)